MKSTIKKFGLYALISSFVLFQLQFVLAKNMSYSTHEVLGYLTIVLSLLFVYFGIKYYREKENNGLLTFRDGLLIGLAITAFASIGIAIADYIYVTVFHPDFITDYSNYQLEKLKPILSPEELALKQKELLENAEKYGHPAFMAFIMFITVFLLGTIITLLSTLVLKTKARQ